MTKGRALELCEALLHSERQRSRGIMTSDEVEHVLAVIGEMRDALRDGHAQRNMSEGKDMSETITVYGSSDDLIEIEGATNREYDSADSHFVLVGRGGQARLRVWYTKRGVWAIAAAPVDEDVPMLPVTLTSEGYSAKATVEGVNTVVREADDDA